MNFYFIKISRVLFVILSLIILTNTSVNAETEKPLDVKGFVNMTGGQSSRDEFITYDGLGKRYTATPLSSYGLMFNKQINEKWDGALMLLARGISDTNFGAEVEWGQLAFHPTSNFTFRFGKQKLPFYFISDLEPTGVLYPWIRPPEEVYSMVPIFAYNGISAEYKINDIVGGDITAEVYQAELKGHVRGTTPYDINGNGFGSVLTYRNKSSNFVLRGSYLDVKIDKIDLGPMNNFYNWSLGTSYETDDFVVWYERASLNTDSEFLLHKQGDFLTLGSYFKNKTWLAYLCYARTLIHEANYLFGDPYPGPGVFIDDGKQKSAKVGLNYYYSPELVVKVEMQRTWIPYGTDTFTTTAALQDGTMSNVPNGYVDTNAISLTALF